MYQKKIGTCRRNCLIFENQNIPYVETLSKHSTAIDWIFIRFSGETLCSYLTLQQLGGAKIRFICKIQTRPYVYWMNCHISKFALNFFTLLTFFSFCFHFLILLMSCTDDTDTYKKNKFCENNLFLNSLIFFVRVQSIDEVIILSSVLNEISYQSDEKDVVFTQFFFNHFIIKYFSETEFCVWIPFYH